MVGMYYNNIRYVIRLLFLADSNKSLSIRIFINSLCPVVDISKRDYHIRLEPSYSFPGEQIHRYLTYVNVVS